MTTKTKTTVMALLCLIISHPTFSQCDLNGLYIPCALTNPSGATDSFDTDGDNVVDYTDEFIQICNDNSTSMNLSGYQLADLAGVKYTFGSISIGAGECLTVVTNWTGTGSMPSYIVDLNSTEIWDDAGDFIKLIDPSSSDSCEMFYPCFMTFPVSPGCPTIGVNSGSGTVDCSMTPSNIGVSPLPVHMTYFTGDYQKGAVELNWQTASEVNNSHFEVYRSNSQDNFEKIGEVAGSGTTEEVIDYVYEDQSPLEGISFYQLLQKDYDGTTELSITISVEWINENVKVVNSDQYIGLVQMDQLESYEIVITDLKGAVVYADQSNDQRKWLMDKSNLKPGVYIVQMRNSFKSYQTKFIVE